MTSRGTALQGALAGLALFGAYVTWQRPTGEVKGDVEVISASKGDLERIRFEGGDTWFEMYRAGGRLWMKTAPGKDGTPPQRELLVGDAGEKFWARFAPLRAGRSLGKLDPKKLEDLGVAASKKKLEVKASGTSRKFVLASVSSGDDAYLKDEATGEVYLVQRALMSDADGAASRLTDRRFHVWKAEDYDAITVSAGGKKRTLAVVRQDKGAVKLRNPTADKPDDVASSWHDRVWALWASDVLGKGEAPKGGEPAVAVKIEYTMRGRPVGFVELGRVDAAPAPAPAPLASSGPEDAKVAPDLYARTEHAAGWLKLSPSAAETISEGERIAAGN